MSTKIIQLKDMDGNILLPQAYSASHDNHGDDFSSVYATITTVNTKADDSAVVHLSGNEVITGVKTLNPSTSGVHLVLKSNVIDTTVTPTEEILYDNYIDFRDKNDVLIGRIFNYKNLDGDNGIALQAWNGLSCYDIGVNSSGVCTATTPSSASDNSTKIATTAWVNNHIDVNPNVVRTTGSQSIAGSKTFTQSSAPIYFRNNNVEQMTVPDAYSEQMVVGIDQNGIRIGSLGIAIDGNGASRCYIASSKQINGEYKFNVIDSYVDLNGNFFTYIQGQRLKGWVIETYKSGTTWYRKWSDGWIEQGGQTPKAADNICTITFPIAFTQDNPNVQMTRRFYYANDSTASQNRTCGIWGVSRTGFSTYDNGWSTAGGSVGVYYACGY